MAAEFHFPIQRQAAQPHSRTEDWLANLPAAGIQTMCTWERYCAFAREPERRKVAGDARIQVDGAYYEVDPGLAGETVVLWWGLFDPELFVEFGEKRFGPYRPSGGPIPLHGYRKPRQSQVQQRADRIEDLAAKIAVPRTALSGVHDPLARTADVLKFPARPFEDPDPYGQFAYTDRLDALGGVSDLLHRPLARLAEDDIAFVNALVAGTLDKAVITKEIKVRFSRRQPANPKDEPTC